MKTLNLIGALVACCLATSTLVADESDKQTVNPSGTWRWEYEMQGETCKDALMLNLGKEGKVTGIYVGNGKNKIDVKNGKMEGDKISLEVPFQYEGTETLTSFSGAIEEDQLKGVVLIGEQEYPWAPQRSVTMDDVVGTWEFSIETPNGNVLKPILKISKKDEKFVGAYTSQQGLELDVKPLELDKNNLLLTVTTEYEGSSVRVDYKGRPYGDTMQGTLAYDFGGNTGEGAFSAQRKAEKKSKQRD